MLCEEVLKKLIEDSLALVIDNDSKLLELNVREEAISHRLAHYLEVELKKVESKASTHNLVVDCEYDKHIDADKKLSALIEKYPSKRTDIVRPDIVLHHRGDDHNNFIVIEVKKRQRNYKQYAKDKVHAFVNSKYKYKLGAYIELATGRDFIKCNSGQLSINIKIIYSIRV